MKYNKLYSSILKAQWMLAPATANQHFPAIVSLLKEGKWMFGPAQLSEGEEGVRPAISSMVMVVDEDGDPLKMDKDGLVEIPENSVAIIDLIGVMRKYGNYYCAGTDDIVFYINMMLRNQNIKGIILRMDSGGGSVDAIAPLLQLLHSANKPIVALCDLCASAAYYSAIGTDHIMAENNISSEFGSIGVMVSFMDFREYFEKEGIKEHIVYAPESDYKNRDFMKALDGDYEELKKFTLSPLAKKFQADVKAARGSKLKLDTEGILAGRMFYAEEALEIGLIDSIGDLPKAVQMVHRLAAGKALKETKL